MASTSTRMMPRIVGRQVKGTGIMSRFLIRARPHLRARSECAWDHKHLPPIVPQMREITAESFAHLRQNEEEIVELIATAEDNFAHLNRAAHNPGGELCVARHSPEKYANRGSLPVPAKIRGESFGQLNSSRRNASLVPSRAWERGPSDPRRWVGYTCERAQNIGIHSVFGRKK